MTMLSLPRARRAPAERSKRYSYESWGTVSITLFSATATLVQFYREESGGGRLLLICAVPSRFGLPRHIFRSAGMQLFLPCGVQPLPSASDGVSFSRAPGLTDTWLLVECAFRTTCLRTAALSPSFAGVRCGVVIRV